MDWLAVLILILVANGSPVILARLLGKRLDYPVDAGLVAMDGGRLFGSSKTLRGVVAGICGPAVLAPWLGLDWRAGLAIGVWAMLGDLLSSFTKRRLGQPSSAMAVGLDQVPECLLPALAVASPVGLSLLGILSMVLVFFGVELLLSRLLFRVRLRKKPY